MSAYVDLFRQAGYPWVDHQLTPLLDVAFRTIDGADDPDAMAEDLAKAIEAAAEVVREYNEIQAEIRMPRRVS